jgi:hypothetical protein
MESGKHALTGSKERRATFAAASMLPQRQCPLVIERLGTNDIWPIRQAHTGSVEGMAMSPRRALSPKKTGLQSPLLIVQDTLPKCPLPTAFQALVD